MIILITFQVEEVAAPAVCTTSTVKVPDTVITESGAVTDRIIEEEEHEEPEVEEDEEHVTSVSSLFAREIDGKWTIAKLSLIFIQNLMYYFDKVFCIYF